MSALKESLKATAMSSLETINRKNAESLDKKMEKSKFKPLFDRVDELKVECAKIDYRQQ